MLFVYGPGHPLVYTYFNLFQQTSQKATLRKHLCVSNTERRTRIEYKKNNRTDYLFGALLEAISYILTLSTSLKISTAFAIYFSPYRNPTDPSFEVWLQYLASLELRPAHRGLIFPLMAGILEHEWLVRVKVARLPVIQCRLVSYFFSFIQKSYRLSIHRLKERQRFHAGQYHKTL